MKAHIFLALLNESYRMEAKELLMQANIVSVPHMKNPKEMLNELKHASTDPLDLFDQEDDYTNINKLKDIFK